jgi:hypothetical protein
MNREEVIQALRVTGQRLAKVVPVMPPLTLYLVGGVAGMLTGQLAPDRTTGDCDAMDADPAEGWERVLMVAREVAEDLGLSATWLNGACRMYRWQMPLGWKGRCVELEHAGKLRVMALSRQDLIAAKVMGAPQRGWDRDDLQIMRPTPEELRFVEAHLDRMDRETEPGHCDPQRTMLNWLRSLP